MYDNYPCHSARRLRTTVAVLAGATVAALGGVGDNYGNYRQDNDSYHVSQTHGNAYTQGYLEATVSGDKNKIFDDGLGAGILAIATIGTFAVSGRRKEYFDRTKEQ
jgi:hypothetical protein